MRAYKVTLFGHRDLYGHRRVEEKLCPILLDLLHTKPYVEFYIGRNGEFDIFAASLVKRTRKIIGNETSELILVLPYVVKDIEDYEKYYSSIIIPECVEGTHPKGAIAKRNKWMIEESDLLICYVEHSQGGAYTAMKYAKRIGKDVINLAQEEI